MQAITTKFLGATDFRGSRIVARCQARRVTVPWDHALGVEENHQLAAQTLAEKLGWAGQWYGGALPDGTGQCFVCVSALPHDSFSVKVAKSA